ncbi:hypothetical protein RB200_03275 [Streptomyces sp. PmtG]
MSPPGPTTAERRPRALVIDHAWRGLGPGLESLSGPGGAPLTRTVKLIVLPLVVRPALRPELAADFLASDEAARLEALIHESGARLAATAQWFTLLKKARRALGVVAGNPQDLYFQRCFELATDHGAPTAGANAVARAVVQDVADAGGGRTVEALKALLADAALRARLDAELTVAWESRRPAGDAAGAVALAAEALEACGAPEPTAGSAAYASMVGAGHGGRFGRVLWARASGVWGGADPPAHLGLTARPVPSRPEVGRGASTATLPAPLDRTLFERLFAVLQSSARREELPTVPELVAHEVGRSCAPLGLCDESLRVAVVLGGSLAVGLDPLGTGGASAGSTAAHRAVNSRWRREASVLRARRMTVSPRPDPDGGALDALAQDLRTPWAAYMRRLWVRLHGRRRPRRAAGGSRVGLGGARRGRPLGDDGPPRQGPVGAARPLGYGRGHGRAEERVTAGAGADVRVGRGEDGVIRVAAGPADGLVGACGSGATGGPDFTRSVLDVAGAVLMWPVLAGPGLPVTEVHDVGRAQQWLWAVHGERVAAAVHALAGAGAREPLVVREVPERPTAVADAAARLAFGHWAARWWPASYTDGIAALEPGVLALELAALTHQCQQLFDDTGDTGDTGGTGDFGDQPDDCVAELVEEHRSALDPLIQWWRTTPQPADTAWHLERVLRLVDDAADCAGLDGPELRRLRSALDQEQDHGHGSAAGVPVGPGALFARQGGYALAAGDPLRRRGPGDRAGFRGQRLAPLSAGVRRRRRERRVLDRSGVRRAPAVRGRGRRARHGARSRRRAARRGGPGERRPPDPGAPRPAGRRVGGPGGRGTARVRAPVVRVDAPAHRRRGPAAGFRPGPRARRPRRPGRGPCPGPAAAGRRGPADGVRRFPLGTVPRRDPRRHRHQ